MDILIATSHIVNSGLDALREEPDVVVCISVCTCVYVNIACAIARISAIAFSSRVQSCAISLCRVPAQGMCCLLFGKARVALVDAGMERCVLA